ncbi:hypothetical protein NWF32_17130 [Pseudomonas qingdaonensis]|nr:hypothetical protein [Pseudomonas qingdaonensis]
MSALKPIAGWLLAVALTVAVLAINHSDGYYAGFAAAKAEGDAALAEQKQELESERRQAAEQAAMALRAGDRQAAGRTCTRQPTGRRTGGQEGRAAHHHRQAIWRSPTCHKPLSPRLGRASEPLPPADFTAGFIRVWNSALFGTASPVAVPATDSTTGRTDAAGTGAGAADDLIAGITRADLLSNHVRNSRRYAGCRAQLNKLIEWNANHGRN